MRELAGVMEMLYILIRLVTRLNASVNTHKTLQLRSKCKLYFKNTQEV